MVNVLAELLGVEELVELVRLKELKEKKEICYY